MMQLMNEIDVLKDVSQKLQHLGIEYMMTGSLAMNYYSEPRMTRDIDIVVSIKKEDLEKILSAFKNDYYISGPSILTAIKDSSMFNIIHNKSVIKVDLIIRKDEKYRKLEFERRQKIRINDFDTYIVSKEDLILSKLIWAKGSQSELQHRDIKNLLATGYDKQYLVSWASTLNLETELGKFINE